MNTYRLYSIAAFRAVQFTAAMTIRQANTGEKSQRTFVLFTRSTPASQSAIVRCPMYISVRLGVIANVLKSLPDPRGIRVLAGDTAIQTAKNVFRSEQVELVGGGGTDMAGLIVAAAEERPAPKAILVVTDGYTGWPQEPVGPRVMACLTQARTAEGVPKWIDTVVLNPEDLNSPPPPRVGEQADGTDTE